VFWGPTEALFYYNNPSPLFSNIEGGTAEAMTVAVQQTLFHWALPQLAVFTIMGIAIGYFAYNYDNVPLRVSSALTPIRSSAPTTSTARPRRSSTSSPSSRRSAARHVARVHRKPVRHRPRLPVGINMGDLGILLVVTMMTLLFTTSMVLGVDKGIRRLSNFNMILFVVLMFTTFIVGPTLFLVLLGTQAFGGMVSDFVSMSLFTGAGPMGAGDGSATGWINAWTVFYWAWALSWSPFAGLFIARISKGRTVREVAFTGIVATSGATIPWFTFVGGTPQSGHSTTASPTSAR